MNILQRNRGLAVAALVSIVAVMTVSCAMMDKKEQGGSTMPAISLSGAQEVPPVSTAASGKSTIKIASDKSVSGMVQTSGIAATAAHIHEAPMGANGPVIIPLTKTPDGNFSVPENAKLTDAQYASYMAGNLYVNVHSAAYPGGEIRAQLSSK